MAGPYFTRDEVKPARQLAGLSQRELAELAGVSQSRVAAIEARVVPVEIVNALNTALAGRFTPNPIQEDN